MEDFISKHPLFERWKALKGRKVLIEEWRDFRAFLRGVGDRPEGSKKLRRIDPTKPYGPGNVEWGKTPTREETLAYYRAWNKSHPGHRRAIHLRQKYDLTSAQYEAMYAAQRGKCAICGGSEKASHKARKNGEKRLMAVDHDHTTGAVRALLCTNCNTALGAMNDDPALFAAAIQYLAKWGKVPKIA